MSDKNEVSLAKKPKLIENVLLIEGITRAGKFLLGNLLNAIDNVEHPQYRPSLEHIPFLVRLRLIRPEVAKAIIQISIDNYGYDTMIGRGINFRRNDKSSIYNSLKLKEYLQRASSPDGDVIVEHIQKRKAYFPYIVHETFPNISIFFEIYRKLRVIKIERNPVDLTYSWFQRGWGRRWGVDLRDFSIPLQGIDMPIPWFAYNWPKEYENSSEMGKVIKSLHHITEMTEKTYDKLSREDKQKIHILTYERLLTQTDREIKKISTFLDEKILPGIEIVKTREKLPASDPALIRNEKAAFIKKQTTHECFSLLMSMEEEYNKKFNV